MEVTAMAPIKFTSPEQALAFGRLLVWFAKPKCRARFYRRRPRRMGGK